MTKANLGTLTLPQALIALLQTAPSLDRHVGALVLYLVTFGASLFYFKSKSGLQEVIDAIEIAQVQLGAKSDDYAMGQMHKQIGMVNELDRRKTFRPFLGGVIMMIAEQNEENPGLVKANLEIICQLLTLVEQAEMETVEVVEFVILALAFKARQVGASDEQWLMDATAYLEAVVAELRKSAPQAVAAA